MRAPTRALRAPPRVQDLFSIRQHEVTADVYQIGEIIRRVKRVLMVLGAWHAGWG